VRSDIHVTASCGCFVTDLGPAGVGVAMCKTHTARARLVFDRPADQVDELLAHVYADDPARVVIVNHPEETEDD
jgi:hypothetical protein